MANFTEHVRSTRIVETSGSLEKCGFSPFGTDMSCKPFPTSAFCVPLFSLCIPLLLKCSIAGLQGSRDTFLPMIYSSTLAVSFIIHLQLLNKSALHHVWSKLFLQDELTSTFLSYFLLIFVLGRFHLSGRHAGRNKTLLLTFLLY